MVATMSIKFDFGGADTAPGTSQTIDDLGPPRLKFKLGDNATIDEANPIVIPGAGLGPYYSYRKHLYLYCVAPDGHTISSVKLYSDGSNSMGTGVDTMVGLQFPVKNSGSSAGYRVADNAAEMVADHEDLTSSASIFTYTSASPLSVTISEAGAVINLATETSNYWVMQVNVSNTASAGTTATEPGYVSYTEA